MKVGQQCWQRVIRRPVKHKRHCRGCHALRKAQRNPARAMQPAGLAACGAIVPRIGQVEGFLSLPDSCSSHSKHISGATQL